MMLIPRTALAVYRATSDDPSRKYALNGIKIERGEGNGLAIGTDGKMMAALRWRADGEPASLLAPKDECRAVAKSDCGAVAVETLGSITGQFPAWRECLPNSMPGEVTVAVNARLLRKALSILIDHTDDGCTCPVHLTVVADDGKPIMLTANNRDTGHCGAVAVMPVRDDKPGRLWDVPEKPEQPEPIAAPPQPSAVCWSRLVAGL